MSSTYDHPEDVLRFCQANPDAALVIVNAVTGGTLRAVGAMMAVTESVVAGYISNGCVDADIVTRARSGEAGHLIYGDGSPFRDIVLPCGGRVELSLVQNPDQKLISAACAQLSARKIAVLSFDGVTVSVKPRLCLRIAGRGAACVALAELAVVSGFQVKLQSPDPDIWPDTEHLIDPNEMVDLYDDSYTAVVLLFHDHDWEPTLLAQAVGGDAFYVGAMGSQKTHDARRETLLASHVALIDINRIHAPIGMMSRQRDARSLALSILAEVVQVAQEKNLL